MRIILSILLLVFLTTPSFAKCDSGEKIVKLGTYSNADLLARNKAVNLLRDVVNREMQGVACMEIIADEARFKGAVGITALQNGDVNMMAPRFQTLGDFSPAYRVFDMPFAFGNLQALEQFQTASSGLFVTALKKNGLQSLGFWHENFKQIAAKRPVYLPEHVAGLRFREGRGKWFRKQTSALKATSRLVAENDLLGALKKKSLGAQITNWVQIKEDGTAKLLDGVSETNHGVTGYQLLAARSWWGDLPPSFRKKMAGIIGRISRQNNYTTASRNSSAKKELMGRGVAVRVLTRSQRKAWQTALRSLWDNYTNKQTVGFIALIEEANRGL